MLWTISKAAPEFGIDRATLSRRLRELGIETPKHDGKPTLTTKQIMAAVVGDLEREKIRDTAASADARELKNAMTRRDLIAASEVTEIISNVLMADRGRSITRAARLAARCNPQDPQHAYNVLQDDCDAELLARDNLLVQMGDALSNGVTTEDDGDTEGEEETKQAAD